MKQYKIGEKVWIEIEKDRHCLGIIKDITGDWYWIKFSDILYCRTYEQIRNNWMQRIEEEK